MFQAEAEAALKKDRESIDGRPMFISRCDADKCTRQPGFKYSTTLEKKKLFVKGEILNFVCMGFVGWIFTHLPEISFLYSASSEQNYSFLKELSL
jgi:hypothetical protein